MQHTELEVRSGYIFPSVAVAERDSALVRVLLLYLFFFFFGSILKLHEEQQEATNAGALAATLFTRSVLSEG